MTPERYFEITSKYNSLKVAVIGDFCLDRYLEIDTSRTEISIETGLPVYNVTNVRAQPGGAGTIVNNLVALGVGTILPVSFCGDDGEGYELRWALGRLPGLDLSHFLTTPLRRTFTYCKPLLMHPGRPPEELNRLDSKNWTGTPAEMELQLADSVRKVASQADALIFLVQVDRPETGVITQGLLKVIDEISRQYPDKPMLADSRQSLKGWPPVSYKMNAAELAALLGQPAEMQLSDIAAAGAEMAKQNRRPVFISLSEKGIMAAESSGQAFHTPALPLRGAIDIVGAGDCVTANLASALASSATLQESIEIAAAASSHVIHQLGTTGTASVAEIRLLLGL
ncbi:MAG: bifunctional heptose 7-phosphate kinase/heptose 1-phosphate adenyltransferase [bacterium]